jgi:flagellar basal body-associated protein FliL
LGVDVPNSSQSGNIVLIVVLMLLICLLLPLMASLYFDSLTAQKRTERTEVRIEKILKELEKKDKQ